MLDIVALLTDTGRDTNQCTTPAFTCIIIIIIIIIIIAILLISSDKSLSSSQ
jgi:uncharacterized membrane protein